MPNTAQHNRDSTIGTEVFVLNNDSQDSTLVVFFYSSSFGHNRDGGFYAK